MFFTMISCLPLACLKMIKKIVIAIFLFLMCAMSPNVVLAGGSLASDHDILIAEPSITEVSKKEQPLSYDYKNQEVSTKQIPGDNTSMFKDVVLLLLGWVLGFVTVVVVDWLKEPNLHFSVGSVDDGKSQASNDWRFLHIRIVNRQRKFKFSPLITNPAFASKAIVTIDGKTFAGRWTSKGEPLIYGTGRFPVGVDLNATLVTPREDIQPSDGEEAVQVAIGMKYDGEPDFSAFNNESYLYQPNLKNPKYNFGVGSYNGVIEILTLGKKYPQKFRIHNESSGRGDFWLELV